MPRRRSTTRAPKPTTTHKVPTTIDMPCRPSKTSAENPTTTEEVIKKRTTTHKVIKKPTTTEEVIKEHTTTEEVIKDPTTTKEVIKKFGRSMLSIDIALQLNAALQNSFRPYLKDELCVCKRLDEGRLKKYGDYLCSNILRICEILRSQDPNHKHGIVAWAPMVSAKRAIVDFPAQDIDVDGVRSCYIRDAFVRMLEYSGVEVSGKICNDQSLLKVKKYFPEEQGTIRKKEELLFVIKEKASRNAHANYVHEDLASLWCGIYEQKADWIVYVAPVRQRDYIRKCFTAAKGYYEVEDFAADRDFKKHPTMSYLGYGTSGDEQAKLFRLWGAFLSKVFYKKRGGSYVGEAHAEWALDCMVVNKCLNGLIKYAYLKTHKYSECALDVQ
ncbi:hypothetical protein Tco_0285690, partial [Tanacetum coccineum]